MMGGMIQPPHVRARAHQLVAASIFETYVQNNPGATASSLISVPSEEILAGANYNPGAIVAAPGSFNPPLTPSPLLLSIWNLIVEPGEASDWHLHGRDYVTVIVLKLWWRRIVFRLHTGGVAPAMYHPPHYAKRTGAEADRTTAGSG